MENKTPLCSKFVAIIFQNTFTANLVCNFITIIYNSKKGLVITFAGLVTPPISLEWLTQ